ncbi:MAG: hypothetical protein HYS39_02440, partial [Proteobacteria bacterium]|nr:hypothetical protein [Pseudomonadota bacterium]
MQQRLLWFVISFLISFNLVSAFDEADVRFEVAQDQQKFKVRVHEKNRLLLDQPLETTALYKSSECHFFYRGGLFYLFYEGQDKSSLNLVLDREGNILLQDEHQTLYKKKKIWGFSTPGHLIHHGTSLFYAVYVRAKEVRNYGIWKLFTAEMSQEYLFNRGIIHFGDESAIVEPIAYQEAATFIKKEAKPTFQKGIVDDYGVILAEKGLKIQGLHHKAYGLVDLRTLQLDKASIQNQGLYSVEKTITGTVQSFENKQDFYVGCLNPSQVTIDDWMNTGAVH